MTKAFDRGANAARRGRPLESNPFARRGAVKRAAQWAEGWNSVDYRPVVVPADWKWPKLRPIPNPPQGDYDRRERGLWALMRPRDLIEYDVLRAEMRSGLVVYVPEWARIPYAILWAFADGSLGERCDADVSRLHHPMKWLCSVVRQQGYGGGRSPLVTSAYEELMHGSIFEPLPDDQRGPRREARRAAFEVSDA